MQLFYHPELTSPTFQLPGEESKHLIKVLRKKVGDQIHFTDGKGKIALCRIDSISQKSTTLQVLEETIAPEKPYQIHLAIAPTKNADRMEWMTEKTVEIGLDRMILMKTDNSERNFLKSDRLEKKAVSAMKQSLKSVLTEIETGLDFKDIIADPHYAPFEKFIAYVDQNIPNHLFELANPKNKYLILVGPEGDFSPDEINAAIEAGFKPCSLGHSRLRTETAGLAAVHTLNLLNEIS
ncbi:16S rRNA (uracil(1498)-N(3))-methyltransferase [Litoribacter ruber]|uniref:16S rRNA (uracil(1498)-N(3))-methyltransferase n=1 Tax=Litoribacter ruber TaxID=702568 RepID=UPI001BDA11FB|nr:16S rRNA (uracil(1498)-N(3))-methyltransferase [Litoribacter ruber]MBT0811674.1 16S rRNA (uracil(1498)-N(3))-methyltransferase [Litoribacter ruber]